MCFWFGHMSEPTALDLAFFPHSVDLESRCDMISYDTNYWILNA